METKDRKRPTGRSAKPTAASGTKKRTTQATKKGTAVRSRQQAAGTVGTRSRRTAAATASARKKSATASVQKRRTPIKKPLPEVVYVQPGPFNKYRFMLQLVTVVAVVLALLFGMSIFFKVKTVTVTGNEKYTAWDVREASGILDGENLLTISEPRISNNIKSKLPYADQIRVGIKLPDTVKIEIVELEVVYSVEATDGSWWLMRSDGGLVEQINAADAQQHTMILGVKIAEPESGKQAVTSQPQQTDENGETIPVTVLASQQLETAISVAQFLEDSGIIGEAASIDVTNPNSLELWYGQRYQVTLGDSTELGYKIRSMKAAIAQMGDYQSGILDVSFTTWPNEVGYTPFP